LAGRLELLVLLLATLWLRAGVQVAEIQLPVGAVVAQVVF